MQLALTLRRAFLLCALAALPAALARAQSPLENFYSSSEVERYIVMPGQATSYMVGKLRILELREQARSLLGEAFSVREFHNVVLSRHSAADGARAGDRTLHRRATGGGRLKLKAMVQKRMWPPT